MEIVMHIKVEGVSESLRIYEDETRKYIVT